MANLLREAVQRKRQFLIDELIKSGIYKINDKHLYEWTLSELEKEFKTIEKLLACQK
ncbi:Fur-regulated basic protein FbpA [Bacillus sp. BRMEA1]|uniref:Fur-regulated basic protein FbpA n=1 Tax=Neobacillus endophyticus TaxID=2738405 RepID=UPI001565C3AC|nr:Fur-regulated basic protein FbpA [Neobacillus endophyticus]NRD79470.1 Fur-regulated basic protein FbpA [Neobacillus endophyticus]